MTMISLKLPKKSKKDLAASIPTVGIDNGPTYPYGTSITFDTDTIKKVPVLDEVKGGEMVEIHAMAKVTEVRIRDTGDADTKEDVELQIQDISIARDPSEEFSEGFDKATSQT